MCNGKEVKELARERETIEVKLRITFTSYIAHIVSRIRNYNSYALALIHANSPRYTVYTTRNYIGVLPDVVAALFSREGTNNSAITAISLLYAHRPRPPTQIHAMLYKIL